MTIHDRKTELSFTITDYQYPECKRSTKRHYNYDANWLMVRVSVTQSHAPEEDEDPCMMTEDLIGMREKMDELLDGAVTCATVEPLEPYIRFAFASVADGFVFLLTYDVWEGRKYKETWSAVEQMDRARFREVRDEIAALCDKFPER